MASILKGQSGQPIQFETQPTINGSLLVKDAVNATGDAPIYACRAWVNFDGTRDVNGNASTANTARLIRSSGNVTSVVRIGTGLYEVTFTEPMSDEDYAATPASNVAQPTGTNSGTVTISTDTHTFNSLRVYSIFSGGQNTTPGYVDKDSLSVSIFR